MNPRTTLRVARGTDRLKALERFYVVGLGLESSTRSSITRGSTA
jgi:hypothetical protein